MQRPASTYIVIASCLYYLILSNVVRADSIAKAAGAVIVSEVEGHTAGFGHRAHFWVSLGSEPTANVTVAVSSTDPEEGIPKVEELVFTPENWDYRQRVDVVGQNRVQSGHLQNYDIALLPAVSIDPNYAGVDADDVTMRGLFLEVTGNQNPVWLTENIVAFHPIDIEYTGEGIANLRFELLNAPAWLSVEADGTIRGFPPVGSSGSGYDLSLRATDSVRPELESTLDLRVNVAPKVSLATQAQDNELRIDDASSDLNDMRFSFESDQAAGRVINLISQEHLPSIPAQIERLSDIFYSDQHNTGKLEIHVPVSLLNDISDTGRLAMFYRLNGDHRVTGWSSGRVAREIRTIDGIEYAILKARSLRGERFIGLKPAN